MTHHPFKTGSCREQASLLPARIEDYVSADNPVRAIEAYVGALDLVALKVRHAEHDGGAGQPPYHPADLLKLYLYGYLNRIRSSRCLAREAQRNVELIWLLRGLTPGYRTIAEFRSRNVAALHQANRDFVVLLRSLDLLGGEMVAIDGAFFDGNASKASIVTKTRLQERLAAVERDIAAYTMALDANDAAEATQPDDAQAATGAADKLQALLARQARTKADLATLAESGQTQVSRTDADARLLSKAGQSVAGYNAQIAVDARHKLIVAAEVVNDGNDTGQLYDMAVAAKQALAVPKLQAVADCGYFNGETLQACEADAIEAFVPEPSRGAAAAAAATGRIGLDAFTYDAKADSYTCPHGAALTPMPKRRCDATGKRRIRYASLRGACRSCPLRARCLSPKGDRRVIERWEHEDVIERHRARMAGAEAEAMGQRRKALAEHPFGTLKCRAGWRHFLMRGLAKVRGEWGLMVLCYNLTRVLRLMGLEKFMTHLAHRSRGAPRRRRQRLGLVRHAYRAAIGKTAVYGSIWTNPGRIAYHITA